MASTIERIERSDMLFALSASEGASAGVQHGAALTGFKTTPAEPTPAPELDIKNINPTT